MSPVSADIHVYPGQEGIIPILFEGDRQGEEIDIRIVGVTISESDQIDFYELSEGERARYQLSSDEALLSPNKETEVLLRIAAPNRDGKEIIAVLAEERDSGGQVIVREAIASIIFASFGQEPKNDAVLIGFDLPKKIISSLPVKATVTVKNDGRTIARPLLQMRVKNIFGRTVTELQSDSPRSSIAAEQERLYTYQWGNSSDSNGLISQVKQEYSQFTFGVFRFELLYSPVIGAAYESHTRTVVIIPWRLLVILFGLSGLVLGILRVVSRKKNAIHKRPQ